jgi:hypothetical protein
MKLEAQKAQSILMYFVLFVPEIKQQTLAGEYKQKLPAFSFTPYEV